MPRTLILISENPEDQVFATEVANTAGLSLKTAKTALDGAKLIAAEDSSVVFVDISTAKEYEAFEAAIQETVGMFSDKVNSNLIHFLSSADLLNMKFLSQSPLFGFFVRKFYGDIKESGEHYGRIVKATLLDRTFGLANLLIPGTRIQTLKLIKSSQKQSAVQAVRNYLVAAGFQARMASLISNGVDEILMNSIFDAPVDDMGKYTLAHTQRSAVFDLQEKTTVELNVGFDGQYVAISAVDHFGSLDKTKLLSHFTKVYDKEEYKVKASEAGAGIGLQTVFRAGASLFFSSESRIMTEVTLFYKKTDSFREFKEQFRFIGTQIYF